jgi:excisionase family DNA binding protein
MLPNNQPEQKKIPRLYRVDEVTTILAISKTHAYRICKSGELPTIRFGKNTIRVRQEDLENFLKEKRHGHN